MLSHTDKDKTRLYNNSTVVIANKCLMQKFNNSCTLKGRMNLISLKKHMIAKDNCSSSFTWPCMSPQTVTGVVTGWTFGSSSNKSHTILHNSRRSSSGRYLHRFAISIHLSTSLILEINERKKGVFFGSFLTLIQFWHWRTWRLTLTGGKDKVPNRFLVFPIYRFQQFQGNGINSVGLSTYIF